MSEGRHEPADRFHLFRHHLFPVLNLELGQGGGEGGVRGDELPGSFLDPQAGGRSAVDLVSPRRTYDGFCRVIEFPTPDACHVLGALEEETGPPQLLSILAQGLDIVFA